MPSSLGCQTCRTRRIKCDRAEPVCQRCIKSNRTCISLEYVKRQSFTIHLENQYAAGKKQRPRGPRSSTFPLQLLSDLQARAVAYFLHNHFRAFEHMPDVSKTWTECFHEWTAAGKQSQTVNLALSSLSLVVFARAQNWKAAATEACKTYLHLLQHLQSLVPHLDKNSLEQDQIDAYLLAMYFMARYESIVQVLNEEKEVLESMKLWSHFDGAAAILKLWYNNHQARRNPTLIIKVTRRTLLRTSVLRGQPLPQWLVDGSVFGETGSALQFDKLITRIITLRQDYLSVKQRPDELSLSVLLNDSTTLEHDLQHWSATLPSDYSFTKCDSMNSLKSHENIFYSQPLLLCAKPEYSSLWNEYNAMYMLLLNTRLQALTFTTPQRSSPAHQFNIASNHSLLNALFQNLDSMIPFSLGKVRLIQTSATTKDIEVVNEGDVFQPYLANLVVWPMALASCLEMLDAEKKENLREGLEMIKNVSSECLVAYTSSAYWTVL